MNNVMLSENFSRSELTCTCGCGECYIHKGLLNILQNMRNVLNKPIIISSGFRCEKHPVEKVKMRPGEHTMGMAVDILCHGHRALQLIDLARYFEVDRLGLHQKDSYNSRYMHIGIANEFHKDYPAAIWTY